MKLTKSDREQGEKMHIGTMTKCAMGRRKLTRTKLIGAAASIAVISVAGVRTVRATGYDWASPAGGDFANPTNWSPSGTPGSSDFASFSGQLIPSPSSPVPVYLSASTTLSGLATFDGTFQLDTRGHGLTIGNPSGYVGSYGITGGNAPDFTLLNSNTSASVISTPETQVAYGTLHVQGPNLTLNSTLFEVGINASGGTATVAAADINGASVAASTGLDIGANANGSLTVRNGATFVGPNDNYDMTLGAGTASNSTTGNLVVDGAGSNLTVGTISAGGYGVGNITVQNAGTLKVTDSIVLGYYSSGSGSILVSGTGSTLTTGYIEVGNQAFYGAAFSSGQVHVQGGTLNAYVRVAGATTNNVTVDSGTLNGYVEMTDYANSQIYTSSWTVGKSGMIAAAIFNGFGDLGNLTLQSNGTANLTSYTTGSVDVKGTVNLNGYSAGLALVNDGGTVNWSSGSLTISNQSSPQTITFGATDFIHTPSNTLVLSGINSVGNYPSLLAASGETLSFDNMPVTVKTGGVLSVPAITLVNGATLNYSGGSLNVVSLNATIGTTTVPGAATITTATIPTTSFFSVGGTTTTINDSSLLINGGSFFTGQLVFAGSGSVQYSGGTLAVTAGDLQIGGPGGITNANGSNTVVDNGRIITGGNLSIAANSSLNISGGTLTASNISFGTNASLLYISGSVNVAGNLAIGTSGLHAIGTTNFNMSTGNITIGGTATIDGANVALLNSSTLNVGSLSFINGGTLAFNGGQLVLPSFNVVGGTVPYGLDFVTPVPINKTYLTVSAPMNVSGSSFVMAGGTLNIPSLVLANGGTFNYTGGTLIYGYSLTAPAAKLEIGGATGITGAGGGNIVQVPAGSSLNVAGGIEASTGATLRITGGNVSTSTLTSVGTGKIAFASGQLSLGSYQTIGANGLQGDVTPTTVNIPTGSSLTLTSTYGLSIANGYSLNVSGGNLTTGYLVGPSNSFNFNAGNVSIASDISVGTAGITSALTLLAGSSLFIGGTTNILPGGSIYLNGGTLNTGYLNGNVTEGPNFVPSELKIRNLVTNGSFSVSSTLIVDSIQAAGQLTINPGAVVQGNIILEHGGFLAGSATSTTPGAAGFFQLVGNLISDGAVSPGDAPGTFNINGTYTQNSDAQLQIDVDGLTAGNFDLLTTTGQTFLGGNLDIISSITSAPIGSQIEILSAGALDGEFSSITGNSTGVPAGDKWQVVYNYTGDQVDLDLVPSSYADSRIVGVASVPEPGSLSLISVTSLALLGRRKRRAR
jgi:fibronectin-binding autotransporter adhesin